MGGKPEAVGIALAGNAMTERTVVFSIVAVLALLIVAEWIAVLTQLWFW